MKKILSVILVVIMLITVCPVISFAAGNDYDCNYGYEHTTSKGQCGNCDAFIIEEGDVLSLSIVMKGYNLTFEWKTANGNAGIESTYSEILLMYGTYTETREHVSVKGVTPGKDTLYLYVAGSVSSSSVIKVLPHTVHKAEKQGFVYPTADTEGYTGDSVCKICKEFLETGEAIPVKKRPVIEIPAVEGNIGDVVSVVVSGKNLTGLTSTTLAFTYDDSVLEFVSVGNPEEYSYVMGTGGNAEGMINWSVFWYDMCIGDADLAVLTFKIIGEGDRTIKPHINEGDWEDYYDMPPEIPVYCNHETKTQGFVMPSYTTTGYSGDIVCKKCNEVLEKGEKLPIKKAPSFAISSTPAKVGETIKVKVTLKNSVGFEAADIDLGYNPDYLKFVKAYSDDKDSNDKQLYLMEGLDDTENGTVALVLMGKSPYTYRDSSFTAEFVVLKEGKSTVEVSHRSWDDTFGISPDPASYVVSTKCEHKEEVIPGKSATCTEKGLTEGKKCSVCDEILVAQKDISMVAHKEKVISGKAATCTATGLTEGKKCSVCGEILVAQKEIAKKAHTPGEWEVVKKAEIGKEGKEQKKCTVCKAVVDERTIPALKDEGIPGDVDGNGKITAADARRALRISAKLDKGTEYQLRVADVTKDNKITAADARKILRISAKLE